MDQAQSLHLRDSESTKIDLQSIFINCSCFMPLIWWYLHRSNVLRLYPVGIEWSVIQSWGSPFVIALSFAGLLTLYEKNAFTIWNSEPCHVHIQDPSMYSRLSTKACPHVKAKPLSILPSQATWASRYPPKIASIHVWFKGQLSHIQQTPAYDVLLYRSNEASNWTKRAFPQMKTSKGLQAKQCYTSCQRRMANHSIDGWWYMIRTRVDLHWHTVAYRSSLHWGRRQNHSKN